MSATTVSFLAQRLLRADARWTKAMGHPEYRDCPFDAQAEGAPFSDEDWARYGFADAWRLAVHAIETELYAIPHVRQFLVDCFSSGESPVFYVAEAAFSELSGAYADDESGASGTEPPDPTASHPAAPLERKRARSGKAPKPPKSKRTSD